MEEEGGSFFFGFRNIFRSWWEKFGGSKHGGGFVFFLNGGSNILHVHQDSSSLPNVPSVR